MGIRTSWHRLPRPLRWAIIGLPCLFVAFVLALNAAIWTGLIERLASGEHRMSTVKLRVDRGWVWWPGTVHVRDLELDIDAYRYQLHLELPRGEADISLLDLVSREFHATRIVGEDAKLVLLLKMKPDKVNERRLAKFPEVDGFDRPIRAEEQPELPPLDEAFTVLIENVDAEISQLWVDEYRFETPGGRLQGNLRAVSGHSFSVWDTDVSVTDATIGIADEDGFLEDVDLHAAIDIDEYDPFEVTGPAVLANFTANVEGSGMVRDISFATMYLPEKARGTALGGGEGPVEVRAVLDHGKLQPDTLVTYDTDAIRVYAGELVIGTQVELAMSVAEQGGTMVSRAGIDLDRVHGGKAGTKHSGDRLTAKKIEGFVAFGQNDLTESDWPLVDARLSIPSLHVADLGDLSGAHDALKSLGGAVDVSWQTTRLKDGRFGHDATLKGKKLSFGKGDLATELSADVKIGARTTKDLHETKIGKMRVRLDDIDVHTKKGDSKNTWVRIDGGVATLDHRSGRVDAQIHGRLDDLRPVFAHMNSREALAEKVEDHDLTEPLDFELGVHVKKDALRLDIDRLTRPALHVRGIVEKVGKRARYALVLTKARIGIFGQTGSKRNVDLAVPDDWLEGKVSWVTSLPAQG